MRFACLALLAAASCGGDGPPRPPSGAAVYLFLQPGCPAAGRAAPEVGRLRREFPGADFRAVYPGRAFAAEAVRAHRDAYYPGMRIEPDPDLRLARACRVDRSPGAAVVTARSGLVYHGRIDDRDADLDVRRPAAGRRDLAEALAAVTRGGTVSVAETPVVGCLLAE